MKCPKCGAWNAAYLPKCTQCGAPLPQKEDGPAAWEESLYKKKPSLKVTTFDEKEELSASEQKPQSDDAGFDPEELNRADLTDELEDLKKRREDGKKRIRQMKEQADRVRRSIQEAQIVRPIPESDELSAGYSGDSAAIRRRQQQKQTAYTHPDEADAPPEDDYGYFGDPAYEHPLAYDDDDPHAPIYYDGYTPDSGDQGALTDEEYMPRRVQTRPAYTEQDTRGLGKRRKSPLRIILTVLLLLLGCGAMGIGGVLIARHFVLSQGMQVRNDNETRVELTATTVDDHPAHVITIYGRENATVYLREMQTSYVIADGKVSITVPDYMWYDTESSTFATAVETDTMDISITPYIRYSQEGDQYQLDPIEYAIDVPLSPIRLVKPPTVRADVGVSIYEVQINVEKGSTVIIDGTNVSTLIRETGNVSKNVQVLPVGDNTISISV